MRKELLRRIATDQAVRDTFSNQLRSTGTLTPALVASMTAVDSANLSWLKPQIGQHGMPTQSQVGKDGVQAAQGRPQTYGTQSTIVEGQVRFDTIEDSAGVDARRARMGLPSLTEYKRMLDSMYGQRRRP